MVIQLLNWLTEAWQAIAGNSHFMAWNLFLALLPLALSFFLFHRPRSPIFRYGVWLLLGLTLLVSFRYVAYYFIHLVRDVGKTYILGALLLTLLFMLLDFLLLRRVPQLRLMSRSLIWWLGFFSFIAFLPNAPYVLTDIIHLIDDIRQGYSAWIVTLVLIPQYLLFMGCGFFAYVLSLMNLGEYLQKQGWGKFILGAEIVLHLLSAIGIYLGRFIRFNSWDILTNPDALVVSVLNDLVGKVPFLVIMVTFIIIAVLYWLMKLVILGILAIRGNIQPSSPDSTTTIP